MNDEDKKDISLAPTITIRIFRSGQTQILWEGADEDAMPETITEVLAIVGALHIAAAEVQRTLYGVVAPKPEKDVASLIRDVSKERMN